MWPCHGNLPTVNSNGVIHSVYTGVIIAVFISIFSATRLQRNHAHINQLQTHRDVVSGWYRKLQRNRCRGRRCYKRISISRYCRSKIVFRPNLLILPKFVNCALETIYRSG